MLSWIAFDVLYVTTHDQALNLYLGNDNQLLVNKIHSLFQDKIDANIIDCSSALNLYSNKHAQFKTLLAKLTVERWSRHGNAIDAQMLSRH